MTALEFDVQLEVLDDGRIGTTITSKPSDVARVLAFVGSTKGLQYIAAGMKRELEQV